LRVLFAGLGFVRLLGSQPQVLTTIQQYGSLLLGLLVNDLARDAYRLFILFGYRKTGSVKLEE